AAAGDGPVLFNLPGGEVDDGNAARPVWSCVTHVSAAVSDIEFLAIAAGIEPVRAATCRNETDLLEGLRVDQEDAIGLHVRHEEKFSIRCNADILRHVVHRAARRLTLLLKLERCDHLALHQIDLDKPAS